MQITSRQTSRDLGTGQVRVVKLTGQIGEPTLVFHFCYPSLTVYFAPTDPSLPLPVVSLQVGNLGLLFMLLFFIFAALGVELFGDLSKDTCTVHAHTSVGFINLVLIAL